MSEDEFYEKAKDCVIDACFKAADPEGGKDALLNRSFIAFLQTKANHLKGSDFGLDEKILIGVC